MFRSITSRHGRVRRRPQHGAPVLGRCGRRLRGGGWCGGHDLLNRQLAVTLPMEGLVDGHERVALRDFGLGACSWTHLYLSGALSWSVGLPGAARRSRWLVLRVGVGALALVRRLLTCLACFLLGELVLRGRWLLRKKLPQHARAARAPHLPARETSRHVLGRLGARRPRDTCVPAGRRRLARRTPS